MKLSTFNRTTLPLLFATVSLLACSANADEAAIKKTFGEKFPQAKVQKITKTDYAGLYEVLIEGQIVYTDAKGTFLLEGNLMDLKQDKDITSERKAELTKIDFNSLPFDLAIKKVKGNGKRKVAVFSDPDCPFCHRLEKELVNVNNVTIYTFLYPIDSLHSEAREKSKAIWCSTDKVKAWDDYMLNSVAPTAAPTCDNPVEKITELGKKHGINGTPTLYFVNGKKVPGAVPAAQLEKMLDAANAGK